MYVPRRSALGGIRRHLPSLTSAVRESRASVDWPFCLNINTNDGICVMDDQSRILQEQAMPSIITEMKKAGDDFIVPGGLGDLLSSSGRDDR